MEQHFVRILKLAQEGIALEVAFLFLQRLAAAFDLAVERADVRRQQAVQAEFVTLLGGEGGSLVGQGIGQQSAGGGVTGGGQRRPSFLKT